MVSISNFPGNSSPVYRIDKFKVPQDAREPFQEKVQETHELLWTLPGLVEDAVLEQTGGPGTFNIVTIAVWESAEEVKVAREAVVA